MLMNSTSAAGYAARNTFYATMSVTAYFELIQKAPGGATAAVVGNLIILESTRNADANTLIHEALHATGGRTDIQMATDLNLSFDASSDYAAGFASAAITNFLNNNRKKETK